MRQQFREEEASEESRPRSVVNAEWVEPTATITERVTVSAPQKTHWKSGMPFIAVGVFVLLVAAVSFVDKTVIQMLAVSLEDELDTTLTTGIGPLDFFFFVFGSLAMSMVIASLYILYGVSRIKRKAPAFLRLYKKRFDRLDKKQRTQSAWSTRVSAIFMFATFGATQVAMLFYGSPPTPSMILSGSALLVLWGAIFGLIGILASTIQPLRPSKENDEVQPMD